ncbi:MAG: acyltransferase family protein [Hyphomonadaceae bacterium]
MGSVRSLFSLAIRFPCGHGHGRERSHNRGCFFLLSSFVLAFDYEQKFAAGMRVGEFMLHRAVHLFPLYLLGTLQVYATLMLCTFGDADSTGRETAYTLQLTPQLFMLPAPPQLSSPDLYPLNAPAWTLVFELFVNLIYVLIFRWLTAPVLIGVVMAAAGLLTYNVLTMGAIDGGSQWPSWWAGFGRSGFAFFAGALCYRLVGSPKTADRPKSVWAIPLLLTLPIVCFIPASPEMRPSSTCSWRWGC